MWKRGKNLLSIILGVNLFFVLTLMEPLADKLDSSNVLINETNFPDIGFRECVKESFDENNNDILEKNEINKATELDIYSDSIGNLKGIEFFTKLNDLCFDGKSLETIDLSYNTELQTIIFRGQPLKSLDTSSLLNLEVLSITGSKIESFDLKHNLKLKQFNCDSGLLQTLDFTKNTELDSIDCSSTNIKSLDISKNPKLTDLNCSDTSISKLELSKNKELISLNCQNTNITDLDLSLNPNIKSLLFGENDISKIDVSILSMLTSLDCSNTKLIEIDLTKNLALKILSLNGTSIDTINLSKNIELNSLNCDGTLISILDLSNNPKLEYLHCSGVKISKLDLSKNLELSYLYCEQNPNLKALDLSVNEKLLEIDCSYSPINSFGKLVCKDLKILNIQNCSFSFLEIPIEIEKKLNCNLTSQKVRQKAILDKKSNKYILDLKKLVPNLELLTVVDMDKYIYNRITGIITFKDKLQEVNYLYGTTSEASSKLLEVNITMDETAEPINVKNNNEPMKTENKIVLVLISVVSISILAYFIKKEKKYF